MNAFIKQLEWFSQPQPNHIVQFYPDDSILIRYLEKFVNSGLNSGEPCVIIATSAHVQALDKSLQLNGTDTDRARAEKMYLTLDARTTLNSFMIDESPNWKLFRQSIGNILQDLPAGEKNIRAYGEMVALLWEDNNPEAVIMLEKYWNDIAKDYKFSLYCAYPSDKFDGRQGKVVSEIHRSHALSI